MSSILRINSAPKINIKGFSSEPIQEVQDIVSIKQKLEETYLQGVKDGQQKIKIELEKDYSEKLYRKYEEVYHLTNSFNEKIEEYELSFEKIVLDTAFIVAEKIVQREINNDPFINDVIKNAINKVIGANEVKIKLHPEDLSQLNQYKKESISTGSFSRINYEGDNRIERGGCLIETDIGNVDATITTQLDELKRKLEENNK
ncbi:MAG: FliH/SctL family protein [Melioribacteraceae bacterium]|nr:FliH/SctL family protein [Melioribacteraceae bacterium]